MTAAGTRTFGLLAVAVLVTAALSGCSTSGPPAAFCVPRIIVEPTEAIPGATVVVMSDTVCDAPPPEDGWSILIAPVGHPESGERTTVPATFDGSFRATLIVPANLPAGEAFVAVEGWDYSECADNASCASPSASLIVLPG